MIGAISPRNFKCFHAERFRLGALTLLTGINGSGKSSLLQSVLLLRQAVDPLSRGDFVRLNGPHQLQLGQALDVFNMRVDEGERSIQPKLELTSGETLQWEFSVPGEEALVLKVARRPESLPEGARGLSHHFTYLCAERVGPRDVASMDALPTDHLGVGTQGEFTAQVLVQREREPVREALRHPETESRGGVTYLGKQVELWMSELVPGLELRAQAFQGTNAVALRMRRSGSTLDWLRPTNMAFGVTYVLPIIIAGLLSPPGALFIVENPEAHLHPSGQSRIGRFLGMLAAAGVQVLVETHSDHVLNGIRLAVAMKEHPLRPEHVVIHHFHADREKGSRATEITVSPTGNLSTWPKGFFDQSEQDLAHIVRARRGQ